ncbi:MAG: FAD-dependent oxidoreductase [Candidatus Latescibacteria bacterium]|nr:FAD-dependent oxidoreductase [Candidatus Latescibacterota bacterium]
MKKPLKLIVIGGVAAGTKSASKARRDDPDMEITIVTEEPYISYAGCGLAYYIGNVVDKREKLFARSPEAFKTKQNITVLTRHFADRINTYDRTVQVTDLSKGSKLTLHYDRVLIATGAKAIIPPIGGINLEGVFPLHTVTDADNIKSYLSGHTVRKACIIGGGYIGIEMAENFKALGIHATVFEKAGTIMPLLFDPDISTVCSDHIREKGVELLTGVTVENIVGDPDGKVRAVSAGGKEYDCELVIIAAGVKPNVKLARDARITIGPTGAIKVDKRMETSVRGIFAAGDCVEMTHLVSGKPCWFPLGSTANKQGRVAGANIAGGNKNYPGVLGTSIVKVFDLAVSRTGLNEREAKDNGYNTLSVTVKTPTRAGYYPGGKEVTLKLTADKGSKKLLGAQVVGTDTVDKIIDTVAAALMGNLSITDLTNIDISYSPPYSTAMGTIIVAAGVLEEKLT